MTDSSKPIQFISVIVPVFNDAEGLQRCLLALESQTLPKDRFEVIVVDNGSEYALNQVVAPFQFVRLVVHAEPGSYAARNAGAAIAKGGIYAFTDADCQPSPDWLEQISRAFDAQPELDALGGRIDLSISTRRTAAELHELVLSPFPQQQLIEKMGFAATANLATRGAVFRSVGPFNERLLSSGDREWGNRLRSAGYVLRYSPKSTVVHPARTSIGALVRRRRRIAGGAVGLTAIQEDSSEDSQPMGRLYPARRDLAMCLLVAPGKLGLSRTEGIKVLVLAACLVAVRILESLRLRLGGRPLR